MTGKRLPDTFGTTESTEIPVWKSHDIELSEEPARTTRGAPSHEASKVRTRVVASGK